MNGAEAIFRAARRLGSDVCFTNFGTTELPFAVAFDLEPGIRPVLGLFEGVCTGAADGYGRMTGKPAMTLLHLGPGLANGIANLHNAKKARSPVLNIVGGHTSRHALLDGPMSMDIEALAGTVSGWCRTSQSPEGLLYDLTDGFMASLYGQVSTLIVPNDYQEAEITDKEIAIPDFAFDPINEADIEKAADLLKSHKRVGLFIGGRGLRQRGLRAAARIRELCRCELLTEFLPACMDRGAGLPEIARIPFAPEPAIELLSHFDAVIIAGTKEPISTFGSRGVSGTLLSEDQLKLFISNERQDPAEALERLVEILGSPQNQSSIVSNEIQRPEIPKGTLTADRACQTLAAVQPEGAIIVDEGVTSAATYYSVSSNTMPHTYTTMVGGSIGYGIPFSIGAAIACPGRPVIDLQADGSAMYTVQALWTQAREKLNITTLICSNRSYNILKTQLEQVGDHRIGLHAASLVDLGNPSINWVKIAESMGVPAVSVNTCEDLAEELKGALSEQGPHLIEMVLT